MIPENARVRLTSAQLEGLNYEELYRAFSPKGRKSAADPRVLFQVLAYGYQCGICPSRKLEEQDETDHAAVFIDGTKLESRVGRYTFVWRKSVEKHLGQVKARVRAETGHTTREGLERHLAESAEGIPFVRGPGHRKSERQKRWENRPSINNAWKGTLAHRCVVSNSG